METTAHNMTVADIIAVAEKINGTIAAAKRELGEEHRIVVLDKGFVFYGLMSIDNGWVRIKNAKNIRTYGTTKGLGELCDGPTSSTVLDNFGDIDAPLASLVYCMPVNDPKKWPK